MTKTEFAAESSSPSSTSRKYAAFPHSFRDPWEETDVEMNFRFAKPTKGEIKRLQDTASKNATQAARNLLISTIHADDKESLTDMMEAYPGIATSYCTALMKAVGISNDLGN